MRIDSGLVMPSTIRTRRRCLPSTPRCRGLKTPATGADRLGFGDAFNYTHPSQVFAEHAALSGFENNGERDFDISALATLSRAQYDALEPTYWPCPAREQDGVGLRFYHPDGKARMIPATPSLPERAESAPWTLNTGRLRDQWHTMTRTGRVPLVST